MGDAVIDPPSWQARAQFDRDGREVRREFLRAVVTQGEDGLSQARLLTGQGSAMLSACVTANALVEAPPSTTINAGEWVRVYPL
jgi:molybdopterin molybdotransferase